MVGVSPRQRRFTWLAVWACAVLQATPLVGQEATHASDASLLRLGARAAVGLHGTGNTERCGKGRALSGGVVADTRGSWLVRGAVDLFVSWGIVCEDRRPKTVVDGQAVGVWGFTEFVFAPRVSGHIGYAFEIVGVRLGVLAGAGMIRTVTDFGVHNGDPGEERRALKLISWRPWYGVTARLGLPQESPALEVEWGRHQPPIRYYSTVTDAVVAERQVVQPLIRVGIAMPI